MFEIIKSKDEIDLIEKYDIDKIEESFEGLDQYSELQIVELIEEFDLNIDCILSNAYLDELQDSIENLQAYLITHNTHANILKYLEQKYDQIDNIKEILTNLGQELDVFKKKLAKHIIDNSKDQDEIYILNAFLS